MCDACMGGVLCILKCVRVYMHTVTGDRMEARVNVMHSYCNDREKGMHGHAEHKHIAVLSGVDRGPLLICSEETERPFQCAIKMMES